MWGSRSLARFAYEVRTWRTFATHTDMAFFSLIYSIKSLKSNYAFRRFFAYTHFKEEDAVTHLLLKTTTPQISNTQSRITHSRMRSSCKPWLKLTKRFPASANFQWKLSVFALLCLANKAISISLWIRLLVAWVSHKAKRLGLYCLQLPVAFTSSGSPTRCLTI